MAPLRLSVQLRGHGHGCALRYAARYAHTGSATGASTGSSASGTWSAAGPGTGISPRFEVAMIETINGEFGLAQESYGPSIMRLTLIHPALGPPEKYHTKSLDEALEDEALHNHYQSAKPAVPGCRVQLIAEEGNRRYIATCMGIRTTGDQTNSVTVQLGTPSQWEYNERPGEMLTRPASAMVTGTPVCRIQLERQLFILRKAVLWSWPGHLSPAEVAITVQQEVVDEQNTEVTTSEIRQAAKGAAGGAEHPRSYVLSKLGLRVGEQPVPVFIHPKDVLVKGFFAKLFGL